MRNRVRDARLEQHLSQGELAGLVGVARQTINAIENDRSVPTLELALKLCEVLEKRVEELFSLDGQGRVTATSQVSATEE